VLTGRDSVKVEAARAASALACADARKPTRNDRKQAA